MSPGKTDFRAVGTFVGLACLTAVFGMGTGVAPPVWSPESRPGGGQAGPGASRFGGVGRTRTRHSSSLERISRSLSDPRAAAVAGRTDRGGQAARLLGPVG